MQIPTLDQSNCKKYYSSYIWNFSCQNEKNDLYLFAMLKLYKNHVLTGMWESQKSWRFLTQSIKQHITECAIEQKQFPLQPSVWQQKFLDAI